MTDTRVTQLRQTSIQTDAPDVRVTQSRQTSIQTDTPNIRATQLRVTSIQTDSPVIRATQFYRTVIMVPESRARVTQTSIDVIADGEFRNVVTQFTADVIADVVAHTPNNRVTQLSIDVIGEPAVDILTPSPLTKAWKNEPYSNFIVALGGLGAITYTLTPIGTITNATQANPVVITTSSPHGLTDGTRIYITGVAGMTALNDNSYYIDVLSPTTFALYTDSGLTTPLNGTGFGAYTSGGTFALALPPGLSLNASTGEISGTPTVNDNFTFSVTATDSAGNSDSQTYTLLVDFLVDEELNMGIGPPGLGYTIARGISGIEAHIEMVDIGLGTSGSDPITYNRSQTYFPRSLFPSDQKFYLELTGENNGLIDSTWTVFNDGIPSAYSQDLVQPPGQFGRIRNVAPFDGPEGLYRISVTQAAHLNDAFATMFRIVAPLKRAQEFMSEVRMTVGASSSAADQTIGGPDLARTSSFGLSGNDAGWVTTGQPVFLYEEAAWERITSLLFYAVIANASFDPFTRYSELAFVDIDDIGEFGFTRKISSVGENIFLNPTYYSMNINPATLRDGHRYQAWFRSVKNTGFFSFNTYLHVVRLQIGLGQGNRAEIYNRGGPTKRIYMQGFGTPIPEIYFQVQSNAVVSNIKLRDLGHETPTIGDNPTGTFITASNLTTVPDVPVRSIELSQYLRAGHDYENDSVHGELVYRFSNLIRRRSHNYMF